MSSSFEIKHISEIRKLAGDSKIALVEDGPINYIVLNKPPFNMFDEDTLNLFHQVLDKIDAKLKEPDTDEQVLITIGQGDRCFSSGFNLKWWSERELNTLMGV